MNTRSIKWTATAIALVAITILSHAQTSPLIRDQHVEAALVGEMSHLQPGVPYRVGLLLRHDPHWHTYWKSSETGYATSIEWDLPDGFSVGELQWPTPVIFDFGGFTEYVYEGETLLIATILPPDSIDSSSVEIGFSADWLMCEEVCIPGGLESVLRLPVNAASATPSKDWSPLFKKSDSALPVSADSYVFNAWTQGDEIILQVEGEGLPDSAYFFSDQATLKPRSAPTPISQAKGMLQINLALAEGTEAFPDRLTGILAGVPGWSAANGSPSLIIDIAIAETPPPSIPVNTTSWAGILLLAFTGGLILNLMPCVFPVLGIKIMGFVGQAGESKGKIVAHGLTFSAGVLLSFWTLAGVLLLLRSGGSQLGWGFQLQSPGFVLILTLLLFGFALNMSGLFEVGQSAVGVGSNLTAKSGLSGSFFSGVLATVVATPCAAPFLAPALGAALALPALGSFAVFTFIALGLASPYLILSLFPALLRWLPKPGAWMETFKQVMSFLLYATVAYLVWVLAGQLTESGGYTVFSLLKVLLALVGLALALWVYGRWTAFHLPKSTRLKGTIASIILLVASLGLGFSGTSKAGNAEYPIVWETWEPGKAEALASEGKVVYVDFTARWCVTCQTNKATVFSSNSVLQNITEQGVILLKADWTHQNPEISKALASFGRSAVPFNLVYGPKLAEPTVLPEILTPGRVLDALENAQSE